MFVINKDFYFDTNKKNKKRGGPLIENHLVELLP